MPKEAVVERAETPLTEVIEADVTRLDAVKGPASKAPFLLMRMTDPTSALAPADPTARSPLELERAAMSANDVNDLPDSAFAHVEAGGSKDDEGKTAPRSLRHYPVHDKAHADNAAARASAAIEKGGDAADIAKKAMPKITAAQKKFGDSKDVKRAERSFEDTQSLLTDALSRLHAADGDDIWVWPRVTTDTDVAYDVSGSTASAGTYQVSYMITDDGKVVLGAPEPVTVTSVVTPVARAGRKLSAASDAQIQNAIDALNRLRDGAAVPTTKEDTQVSIDTAPPADQDPPVPDLPAPEVPDAETTPTQPVAGTEGEAPKEASPTMPAMVARSAEPAKEPTTSDLESIIRSATESAVKAAVKPLEDSLKEQADRLKRVEEQPMPGGPFLNGAKGNGFLVQRGAGAYSDEENIVRNLIDQEPDPVKKADLGRRLALAQMAGIRQG